MKPPEEAQSLLVEALYADAEPGDAHVEERPRPSLVQARRVALHRDLQIMVSCEKAFSDGS